ncbi:integrase [Martelella endophytica]|uniref:Integrase n=1 Tax=Martelella endophytica TaxID=1486262 RepID=A0A0D5LQ38_MAREN|nr:integrase [Martelella endophytica]AJY46256.1 integrase [Martelella endophytica]
MELKAPGLKARRRTNGTVAYYWVASAVSRDTAGYPIKTVRVHGDDNEIRHRCRVLTAELKEWLSQQDRGQNKRYDGTLRSLIRLYQTTPESPYNHVKANTRAMYDESLGLLEKSVGARRLGKLTGLDFVRWYNNFKLPASGGKPERQRRAYKAMQLLRIVIKFGVVMNIAECFRLATILSGMEFTAPAARTKSVTYDQAQTICERAIEKGLLSIAIAQALQFDLTLRQIDVIGRWERTKDPETGGIVDRGQRWVDGLLWSHIGADGVLSKPTSKTGQTAEHDTHAYPMLQKLLDMVPQDQRVGPVVKSETTGLPYRYRYFYKIWREVATEAGVPKDVWNRDSRAGGVTEGSDAGADIEHLRHHANHKNIQTTTRYNRTTLEKTRHVAELRIARRKAMNTQKTDV